MIKILGALVLVAIASVNAEVDASALGLPESRHSNTFGGPLPLNQPLADEGQMELQLVDAKPADENAESMRHVEGMLGNALKTIRAQRTEQVQQGDAAPELQTV
ncbi:unnamed protein product [Caenorhabditis bovis]|uniref:Uncharacterized protein n=1 Tax=Caenorhabditis bovis TaxID=2654633 RepID=A0A8S1EVB9_9PELO|nr:unnamed protein product [Caenorhabditis bovis]